MGDDLKGWNYDSAIPGTYQAYIYGLATKYSVRRKFVSLEDQDSRLLTYLAANYKVRTAGYKSMIEGDRISDDPGYSHLVIQDPRLDAFYFDVLGSYPKVVLFFDDKAELENLKARSEEALAVPYGCYQLQQTMQGYVLSPVKTKASEKPILDQALMSSLLTDTDTFFANRGFYQANNLTHKRGILMFGSPGCGKTTYIKHYLGELRNTYGVLIDCSQISFGPSLFHYLKAVFGSQPKVIVLEDVDGACQAYSDRSAFLNFLDGPRELDNTLTLATTNYPERLDSALLDRPSRFDSILYVGLPGSALREQFLLKWFPDLEGDRLKALTVATDGFSGAYFKELFSLTGLRQCSVEDALKAIQDRRKLIEQFGRTKNPNWGREDMSPTAVHEGPAGMEPALAASSGTDYHIDQAFALKIMAKGLWVGQHA